MKKKIIFIYMLGICLFSGNMIVKGNTNEVQAQLLNPKIIFNNGILDLENEALLYKGYTYISLRDLANMFSKQLLYNEEDGKITIISEKADAIIKDMNTAMKIGKAIVEEHFNSYINDSTRYFMYELECDCLDSQKKYVLYVIFDYNGETEPDFSYFYEYKDVAVYINSVTGGIEIEKTENK